MCFVDLVVVKFVYGIKIIVFRVSHLFFEAWHCGVKGQGIQNYAMEFWFVDDIGWHDGIGLFGDRVGGYVYYTNGSLHMRASTKSCYGMY